MSDLRAENAALYALLEKAHAIADAMETYIYEGAGATQGGLLRAIIEFREAPYSQAVKDRAVAAASPSAVELLAYVCPECASASFEPFRCGGPHKKPGTKSKREYRFVDAVPVAALSSPNTEKGERMKGLVNRIRVEANGYTREDVEDVLVSTVASIRDLLGGEWKAEHDLEVQTTKSGFWGYVVMTRMP
jgi:hypothetical protein